MQKGSVVKSVFDELKSLHDIGTNCWYSKVLELGKTYNIDPLLFEYSNDTKSSIRSIIRCHYIDKWKSNLVNLTMYPILRSYNLFKKKFGCEFYLSSIKNQKYRVAMSRFRSSSHPLEIEHGRYT